MREPATEKRIVLEIELTVPPPASPAARALCLDALIDHRSEGLLGCVPVRQQAAQLRRRSRKH